QRTAARVRRYDPICSGQSQSGTGSLASSGPRLLARALATRAAGAGAPGRSAVSSGSRTATRASATRAGVSLHACERLGGRRREPEMTGGEDIELRLDGESARGGGGEVVEGVVGQHRIRQRQPA